MTPVMVPAIQVIGVGLVIAALIHARLRRLLRPVPGLVVSVLAGIALAWMPLSGGLGLWQWAVSFLDHISTTAIVLLGAHMLGRAGVARIDPLCPKAAAVFVLCYGSVLYASGLGFMPVDIYDWGYGIGPLYFAAAGGLILAALAGRIILVSALTAGLLAHLARVYDSGNLNDSLIDAGLFIVMLGSVIMRSLRGLRMPRRL